MFHCANCGSDKVQWAVWEGHTGVTAPDGYREPYSAQGFKCFECGAIEDRCEEDDADAAQQAH